MLKIEPIQNFSGFGSGGQQGEYYYSQGMQKSRFGLLPNWTMTEDTDSGSLSSLDLVQWFSEGVIGSKTIFASALNNNIFSSANGGSTWNLAYTPGATGFGNGMIVDQTNRLLYATERYLGKYTGGANYTTGTIAVTNGSPNVVGTGTTFTSAMVNCQLVINNVWYTISSFTDATHITLSTNYAGSTASGLSYAIYADWLDQFKDFGANLSPTTGLRPMDTYEDWVVIGNGNNVALLNVTDDSFNATALNLPNGFYVQCIKAGKNGILIGANFNSRGVLLLWDAFSTRSIAPWIWMNSSIKAIIPSPMGYYYSGWIVITSRGIFQTNGYQIQPLINQIPDFPLTTTGLTDNLLPQGAEMVENKLMFWGGSTYNRIKWGVYVLDLLTNLFEFIPASNAVTARLTTGAIFFDSNAHIHTSFKSTIPATKYISRITSAAPTQALYITDQLGTFSDNEKIAEAAKFTIGLDTKETVTYPLTFTTALKIYDFKRNLWSAPQTNAALGSTTTIQVNGNAGTFSAQVGDEVTFAEGVNAGLVTHITAIANQGTATEQWTLADAITTAESGIIISLTPFKLVQKFSFSSISALKEMFFDIKDAPKSKRFLLKLVISGLSSLAPEIKAGQFIYDELAIKK